MNTTTITTVVISNHGFAEKLLQPESNHHLLVSARAYQPGDIITNFGSSEIHKQPSKYTVQVANDQHIILSPEFLQYINHSCNPNVFFNTSTMELTALQPITPGDEFTFFYPSTEWDMAEPFNCLCGSANCLGVIKGAKNIAPAVLDTYKLTNFIQQKRMQLKD
ncbi:MAG: SET domain-containing protein-lysine N-methyltransferase [Chitinophagaceae bacterium]|nr:SET domain-containing protein-lysine N-methyltransferase [Chitinophagaceae bacterium]